MAEKFTSLLFVPGDRPKRIAKAMTSAADLVCVDLEDSVGPENKAAAREQALSSQADRPMAVRINPVASRDGIADLHALGSAPPATVLVPMVEHAAELAVARAVLGDGCELIPLVETVAGLERAGDIAAAPGVAAIMFGGGDLSAELGVALAWEPLLVARSLLVMAAAKARVRAIDVPFLGLQDAEGLAEECRRARALGFAGKAAIHPAQLDAIHAAFASTEQERDDARAALAAWRSGDGSAIRWNGQMLEAPLIPRLQRIAGEAHA